MAPDGLNRRKQYWHCSFSLQCLVRDCPYIRVSPYPGTLHHAVYTSKILLIGNYHIE